MIALAAAVVAALAGAPADPTVALVVTRAAGAESCPDGEALAALVARRLGGRDPVDPLASRKAFVDFARERSRFAAVLRVREADGREGRRTLSDTSCAPLAEATALALAVAIDPLGVDRPRFVRPAWAVRAAEVDPTLRAPRREVEPTPPWRAPPRATPAPGRWSLRAGPMAQLVGGLAPAVMLGPGARVELASQAWRVGGELDALFAPASRVASVDIGVTVFELRLDGCRLAARWSFCAELGLRAWSVTADDGLAAPIDDLRGLVQVGLALGYAASPGVRVELRAAASLPRPVLVLDGRDVWGAWPVSLGLALLGLAP